MPMNKAPRVLSTEIDAVMADESQEREISSRPMKGRKSRLIAQPVAEQGLINTSWHLHKLEGHD